MTQPQPASASARFLDESILPVFTDLRMTAFGRTVIDIAADPIFDSWSFSDKVLYGECLMVCVWVPNLHEETDQNDYCGTTRPG